MTRKWIYALLLVLLVVPAALAQFPVPGGGNGGGGGVGAANVTATSAPAVTSLALDISSLNLPSTASLLVQCWSGASAPFSPVTVTSLNPASTSSITANFTSTANVTCRANSNGGAGATGATGPQGPPGSYAMATGTTLPPTCVVGEAFFKTDAPAGQNIYGCTSTNTWTQQAGGGGGASLSWVPTRTSATVLTLPAIAANSVAINSYTCPNAVAAGATFTVSSGTGTIWLAVARDCTVVARHNVVGSCSAGCTAVSSSSGFDLGDVQLYEWTVTSGSLAATGNNVLGLAKSTAIIPGANISFSTSPSGITISSAAGGGGTFPPLPAESEAYVHEDFLSGTCQGNVTYNGELGWQLNSNSGGETVSCTSDVGTNHPGVLTMSTLGTSGSDAALKWASTSVNPADTFTFRTLVKLSNATNVKATVAITDDAFNNVSSDGCYFEKLSGDTNWFVACMSGGVASTRQDTTVAAGTGWIAFQIQRTSGSNIAFRTATTLAGLTGATVFNVTTQIPTVNLRLAYFVESTTAAVRGMGVDYGDLRITGMTR